MSTKKKKLISRASAKRKPAKENHVKPKAATRKQPKPASRIDADVINIDPVAYNVRRLRIKLGLTQVQLAEKTGWAQSRIAQIECGGQDRRMSTIQLLAKVLGVESQDIMQAVPVNATDLKPGTAPVATKKHPTGAGTR